jgi:hypothetical protein
MPRVTDQLIVSVYNVFCKLVRVYKLVLQKSIVYNFLFKSQFPRVYNLFGRSQFPRKSVELSILMSHAKNKSTDLYGN